jgi:hypothetical protein
MRSNLGGIATLCVGACFVWSCQGDIGSDDPGSYPGGKGGANGAATQPASGSAGHPATGAAGHAATGAAGHAGSGSATTQPTSGAAGQPATSGSAGQPDTGAAGQAGGGSVAPPVSGAAGEPATDGAGQAGSGSVAPPVSGAAGEPATGAAGQAGTGSAVPPATGAAGQPASGSAGAPATGATGQAGASVAPPVGGAGGAPAMPATGAASTIVPLYTSPGDPSWNAVIAAKMAHPKVGVVAIVNPSNGPGGSVSSAYASGIAKLTAAGIRVIGYVATGYTANSPASVKADIDRWKSFYPGQITGIFFDEQSNKAGDVPYYRDLSQYTKAQGLSLTVGNPGTDTAEGFVGALDMMLIYESAGLPSQAAMGGWHANYPPSNFGIIPYASSLDATFVHNARKYVQYIYVQNDNLPNPWDSVPSNFGDLLAALE